MTPEAERLRMGDNARFYAALAYVTTGQIIKI